MLSVSYSSIAAIFSRFSTRYSASALLLTLVSGSVLWSGCSSDAEPASDQTIQAISILGSESGIMGAMHAFDGIEAFVDAVDRESSLQAREMLNDVLRRMDLNLEDAAIDAYLVLV